MSSGVSVLDAVKMLRVEALENNKFPKVLVLTLSDMLILKDELGVPTTSGYGHSGNMYVISFFIHTSLFGMDIVLGKETMVL